MNYKDLNYTKYQDYLEGKEWSELHQFFYKNCGPYKCTICKKSKDLVLHKRSYKYLTLRAYKQKYLVRFLMIYFMKKWMCWLCEKHNTQVHFYNDGIRVPLLYDILVKREKDVYNKYNSLWKKIRRTRASDILSNIGRAI